MSIHIGFCYPGDVSGSFMLSVLDMYADPKLDLAYPPHAILGGVNVQDHRNAIVESFMASDGEWLLFLDADMSIGPASLRRLIDSADPVECPVVGGLCFKLEPTVCSNDTRAMHYATAPTMYRWNQIDGQWGYRRAADYARDVLVQVDATGAACLLIHRTVFDRIAELGEDPFALRWDDDMGMLLSEDMSFCRRCNLADVPIFVNTGARTAHAKTFYVDERFHRKHTVNTGIPDLVVTGTGRCGTKYTAEVLKHCGIAAAHEAVYSPTGVFPNADIQIDVSWFAAPAFGDPNVVPRVVVHQTRNPAHVIQSLADIGFPSDMRHGNRRTFALQHAPQLDGLTPLESAVQFYCDWIQLVEDSVTVDYHVRVEDWWEQFPKIITRELGVDIPDGRRQWAQQQVSTRANAGPGKGPTYTWPDMLTAAKNLSLPLTSIANRYGYSQKELNSARR